MVVCSSFIPPSVQSVVRSLFHLVDSPVFVLVGLLSVLCFIWSVVRSSFQLVGCPVFVSVSRLGLNSVGWSSGLRFNRSVIRSSFQLVSRPVFVSVGCSSGLRFSQSSVLRCSRSSVQPFIWSMQSLIQSGIWLVIWSVCHSVGGSFNHWSSGSFFGQLVGRSGLVDLTTKIRIEFKNKFGESWDNIPTPPGPSLLPRLGRLSENQKYFITSIFSVGTLM